MLMIFITRGEYGEQKTPLKSSSVAHHRRFQRVRGTTILSGVDSQMQLAGLMAN